MNEEQGRKSSSPLSEVNTRDMNSTFTPIGRVDCTPGKIIQEPDVFGHCISQPRQVHVLKDS
jgi:hypothetical protein